MRRQLFLFAIVVLSSACAVPSNPPAEGSQPLGSGSAEPGVTLQQPAPDADGVVKVLLYYDMEGLSGQDDWRSFFFSFPEAYATARPRLMADLNATIDGLFAGGAEVVHVYDAHGSGNPEPDALVDQLDPRAELLAPEPGDGAWVTRFAQPGAYDAVAGIGLHARTGSRGFGSHTLTGGIEVILNGLVVSEAEISAFSWAEVGTPWIFAAGDDVLRDNLAETMPWLQIVVTKHAIDARSAQLRPEEEVLAELRDRARLALQGRDRAQVPVLSTPIRAGLRAVRPASLELLAGAPGVEFDDGAVFFSAADLTAAYRGLFGWLEVARGLGYYDLLNRRAAGDPEWAATKEQLRADWMQVWGQQESGERPR